jgi:hypothetical protein
MARTSDGGAQLLFRFLVAHRILIYVGALIAISMPLGLAWAFDYEVSPGARTAVVAVSMGVILLTYFAERRVGLDNVGSGPGDVDESYSTRLQASVFLAIVGIAAGIYLFLEYDEIAGLVFLAGALFFFQAAYRQERKREGE